MPAGPLQSRRSWLARVAAAGQAGWLGFLAAACRLSPTTAPSRSRPRTVVLAAPSTAAAPGAAASKEWQEAVGYVNRAADEGRYSFRVRPVGLPAYDDGGGGLAPGGGQQLRAVLEQGQRVDLVGAERGSRVDGLAALGLLQPLDHVARRTRGVPLDSFPAALLEDVRWRGQTWALPVAAIPMVLWYDAPLFRTTGAPAPDRSWTWSTLGEVGRALTADPDEAGEVTRWGLDLRPIPYEIFVWQAGGELFGPDRRILLREAPGLRAIRFAADLYHTYRCLPTAWRHPRSLIGRRGIRAEGGGGAPWQMAMAYASAINAPYAGDRSTDTGRMAELPSGPDGPRGRVRATRAKVDRSIAITASAPDAALAAEALRACLDAFEARGSVSGRADAAAARAAAAAGWGPEELAVVLASLAYARGLPLDLDPVVYHVSVSLDRILREGRTSPEQAADETAGAAERIMERITAEAARG